jgi:hypothetical protein
MLILDHISDLSTLFMKEKPRHPLITVIDFASTDEQRLAGASISTGFYSVMFKNYCSNRIKYGRQYYDFQEGSLLCVAPGQVITLDSEFDHRVQREGWGVFFHPPCSKSPGSTGFFHTRQMRPCTCRTRKKITCWMLLIAFGMR